MGIIIPLPWLWGLRDKMNVECPADYLERKRCQSQFNLSLSTPPPYTRQQIPDEFLRNISAKYWLQFCNQPSGSNDSIVLPPLPHHSVRGTTSGTRIREPGFSGNWPLPDQVHTALSLPLVLGLTTNCPHQRAGAPQDYLSQWELVETGALVRPHFHTWPGAWSPLSIAAFLTELDTLTRSQQATEHPLFNLPSPREGLCLPSSELPPKSGSRGPPTFYLEAQLPSPTWPGAHLALSSCQILKSVCSALCKGQGGRVGKADEI